MRHFFHTQKSGAGFTLIELIVYLGIATVALLVFYGFAADVMQAAARIKTTSDVQGNARVVVSRITHDVRTTDTAIVKPGGTLELTKTVGGVTTTTCYEVVSDVVEYGTCQGVGCLCVASEPLSDDSVNVKQTFDPDDSTVLLPIFVQSSAQIEINFMVEPHNPGTADPVTLSTAVVPRSKLYQ